MPRRFSASKLWRKRTFKSLLQAIALASTLMLLHPPTSRAATPENAAAPENATPISWTFRFSGPDGIMLSYRGVPIIHRSTLYVVKPGWAGLHYDQRKQKQEIQKQENGTWRITAGNEAFRAEYELRPIDAQNFELSFRGELLQDIPAQIEFNIGYFNANPLINRPFRAQTRATQNAPASTLNGIVPSFPAQDGLAENDLAPNFQTLEFASRLGQISLQALSTSRLIFADARRYPPRWAKETPIFWCGWLAGMQPLRVGQPVEATLKIHIEATQAEAATNTASRSAISIRPPAQPQADAISTAERPVQIVPRPQKMQLQNGKYFAVREDLPWSVTAPREETRLLAAAWRVLRDEGNLKLAAPRTSASTLNGWCGIRLGDAKPINFPTELNAANWAKQHDAYRLKVDASGVEIVAPTARGAFYGLQTVAQLLRRGAKNVQLPFVEIEDWAVLEFRGAHWYPSQSGVPFHQKLIRVMARYKFNYAVIQCEAARWDSHPEIAAENSISKKDLRALVDWCRANFIEPIPLVNGPGHATWMFRNNQNLDLAEDRRMPYAYAVNNPKSLEFVREILSEAIEVFQPKIFHIGHDEVTMRGRFPNPDSPFYREGQSVTDLVMTNLNTLHDWLAARHIKTMIWGDMFLNKEEGVDAAFAPSMEEAKKRRALLPKDVIVADWHYRGDEKYPSLKLFQQNGLKTVAATWHTPLNVRHFTRAAIETGAWGVLQTTWAGFFPDEKTLDTELNQFTAFILAADYSWSGREELPELLPYDSATRWKSAYEPQIAGTRAGALLDLSAAAQVAPEDWLGLGAGWDLAKFFAEPNATPTRRLDDVAFAIPNRRFVVLSTAPATMAPAGAGRELTLEIQRNAGEIALLHSTLWSTADAVKVARLTVEYADGTHAETDFTTGTTISSWHGDTIAPLAARGWSDQTPAGTPLILRVARWQNPHPEKLIARLHLAPLDVEAGYVLAGVTLLD